MRHQLAALIFSVCLPAAAEYGPDQAQLLLKKYCAGCHMGKAPAGGFRVDQLAAAHVDAETPAWTRLVARVKNGEMPPKGVPAPAMGDREEFTGWVEKTVRTAVCAGGTVPGPYPMRRLNREEYAATMRDLLNIHFNAAHALPADGAGGEGFDNAAETLFFSPLHSEKYLEAAKEAVEAAAKDTDSRKAFLIAEPGKDLTPPDAARKVLEAFVPRAFRRPARPGEAEKYLALFQKAMMQNGTYERSILQAVEAVLVSPNFLFRSEPVNPSKQPELVEEYAMASRLSYFLWGTMPDRKLFELAKAKKLNRPEELQAQIKRMLQDGKSRDFAERFVEQWLGTRELGRDIKPDEKLFPKYYDAELQSAIRYEPILFFQEVLAKDLALTALIDSDFTVLTDRLAKYYGLKVQGAKQQPLPLPLPAGSNRGGVLTMAATLAVSSYPQRTSPVLRGKWILENILGTPPPPPPPDVPALTENKAGEAPKTLRERLERHRANAVCASCHSRIDPMGFALENYDPVGVWRNDDAGKVIDTVGELPDGTKFEGAAGLKKILLERKDVVLRNLTSKMLGYALGRGLTVQDSCTVDAILEDLRANGYRAQVLVQDIVMSKPFRYKEGSGK